MFYIGMTYDFEPPDPSDADVHGRQPEHSAFAQIGDSIVAESLTEISVCRHHALSCCLIG